MSDEKDQLDQFGDAVEKKHREAEERELPEEQSARIDAGHTPNDRDVRAKSTGHGKKTADKWNQ
jgi:hypothetical protein